MSEFPFVCLKSIRDDAHATEIFNEIDENKGGIVLLVEFCEWIKAEEIKADTPTGKLLNAEESEEEAAKRKPKVRVVYAPPEPCDPRP